MRPVSLRTEDIERMRLCLGFVGENEHTRITFDASKEFGQYSAAAASLTVCPQDAEPYPAIIARDGNYIIWDVTDSDLVHDGDGEYQLSFTQEPHIAKTYIGKMWVKRSLVPSGDIPEGIDDFLTRAGAALTAIPETIFAALEAAKESGEFDGDDGVGIQSIEKTGTSGLTDTYTITLTDGRIYTYTVTNGANGEDGDDGVGIQKIEKTSTSGLVDTYTITYTNGQTTTFTVTNGAPGLDGYSPSASVSKSGKVATITITDKNGTTTAEIHDGEDGSDIIDDTAGVGDTDKTFSADKLTADHTAVMSALSKSSENTNIAISAHQKHSLFWFNGSLHIALDDIAIGDTITTEGQTPNASEVTIDEALIKDIQINGASILQDGVANVPLAASSTLGVVKGSSSDSWGINFGSDGTVGVAAASQDQIKQGYQGRRPIVPTFQHISVFYGFAKAAGADMKNVSGATVGTYPEDQKSAISQMLNGAVQVTGTTPVITAKSGIRYICGECATLDITVPESGIIDVVFESGSTPTVLTVTPPTGMTMKWIGDDPTALEANKTYEINIKDGCLGMVVSWT